MSTSSTTHPVMPSEPSTVTPFTGVSMAPTGDAPDTIVKFATNVCPGFSIVLTEGLHSLTVKVATLPPPAPNCCGMTPTVTVALPEPDCGETVKFRLVLEIVQHGVTAPVPTNESRTVCGAVTVEVRLCAPKLSVFRLTTRRCLCV